ncbi:MAG: 6-phosphogluconolactonase, partial [Nocardioidaceae bacterium]|nr:6-phosphogluconolactonase [Nocardioidaceae bacterium]
HEFPASDQVGSAEESAADYAATVRSEGSGGFDILMLGIGPDGHIASLFPGHPGLEVTDAIATAIRDSPKPPPVRMSLTLEALRRDTQSVWFLASGEQKADAVVQALEPTERETDTARLAQTPARAVSGQRETIWFLHSAAASHL